MTDTARHRNRRGEGERLRAEIVAAAAALVEEGGAVSLRAIARRAGVSAPSIYPHFTDLQEILDAVLADGFAELDAAVAAAMTADAADERLIEGCLAYVRYGWRHPERYRFMVAGGGFAPDAVRTFARIEDCLRACADEGLTASADPHADAFLVWAGMHGIATLHKPDRAELRRLGPLDRVALARTMARRLAGL